MRILITIILLFMAVQANAAPRGVSYDSATTNVYQTVHQTFHTLTNLAATASEIGAYDANKKLTSISATALRTVISVPPFDLIDPGAVNIFPFWDDAGGEVDWTSNTALLTMLGLDSNDAVTFGTVTATTLAGAGGGITYNGAGNNGNLATSVNTLQELNDEVDNLDLSGGGSAPVGTMVSAVDSPEQYSFPMAADTTGTNYIKSSIKSDVTGTNLLAGAVSTGDLVVTNLATTLSNLGLGTEDSPNFTGVELGHASDTTVTRGAAGRMDIEGVPVLTTTSTATVENKTISAANNVIVTTKYLILKHPDYGDGVGAIPQTNTYTASGLMHYTLSGNAETNANWMVYEVDCPPDLNTAVAMTARFAFISGGTDADDYVFHLTYAQQAAGAAYVTGTSVSTLPIVMTVTPTTATNGDLQQSSATTLTGWAAALTPGLPMQIRVARLQNTQDDSARDVQLVIAYGSTQ